AIYLTGECLNLLVNLIVGYFLLINLISLVLFGIDKSKATRDSSRISEFTLLLFSIIGGAMGGVLGMKLFRHKTRKTGFRVILYFCLLINLFAYGWLMYYYYTGNGLEIPWM
ncbi:MAG: DUF1294 domain-containing protein, partial [Thermoplasmata archaeon]|nr:DUF1294 domain-containing protein [Thermoplasmata archaeon]